MVDAVEPATFEAKTLFVSSPDHYVTKVFLCSHSSCIVMHVNKFMAQLRPWLNPLQLVLRGDHALSCHKVTYAFFNLDVRSCPFQESQGDW